MTRKYKAKKNPFVKLYSRPVCCWCGLYFPMEELTKEHLLPLSTFNRYPNSYPALHYGLRARSCNACNNARGPLLGAPPIKVKNKKKRQSNGWASHMWKEGMAPWITMAIMHLYNQEK